MKKFAVITFIIIFVVAFSAFIYTRLPQEPTQVMGQPVPITTIAPLSSLNPAINTGPQKVSFSYSGQAISLPDHLPTYVVIYPAGLSAQAALLAKQWSFTNPVKNPVPYVYDWTDKDKHLSYNDKDKSISLILFGPAPVSSPLYSLTPQTLFSILSSFQFFSNSFSFTEINRQAILSGQGEGINTEPPGTATTSITYAAAFVNAPFPFLFSGFTKSTGNITVDQTGKVIAFTFYVTPIIRPEQERRILNTVNQFLDELNGQKGYLAGIGTGAPTYPSVQTATISEVSVSSFSPSYLFIPEESRFVPIIEAVGISNPGSQQVRYYVRISS